MTARLGFQSSGDWQLAPLKSVRASQMSQFADELRERLLRANDRIASIESTYQRAREDLERRYRLEQSDAVAERNALQTLLEAEERRHREPVTRAEPPAMELGEFFLMQLRLYSPMSKDDLRVAAERAGFFTEGESSGRRTHTTLMNYARSRRIRELPGGMYANATELSTLLIEELPTITRPQVEPVETESSENVDR
jgi:hypothetical protein